MLKLSCGAALCGATNSAEDIAGLAIAAPPSSPSVAAVLPSGHVTATAQAD
ncbi:MAG TPA: hypothetical protein VE593_00130 [Nitrososphaeraceae archaeon]|nr:hypothetical protein [Nitrososphaeraceae archaeon]